MKTLMCSLAVVVSLAVTSAVFAASAEDDLQITGTIVEVYSGGSGMVLETAKKERWDMNYDTGWGYAKPKVGEKVTVHYYITGRGKLIASKIEKAGKAREGSKNR